MSTLLRLAPVALAGAALSACATVPRATSGAPYVAYVVSESADQMSRIEFGPGSARVAEQWSVSVNPVEPDGPHGIAASPDGRYVYVTLGHGTPFGTLWKFDAKSGQPQGRVMLGLFPATVDVTPDGQYAFVSNFNLHGDMVPSSVSKVYLPSMTEVARTETCVMPHGSRVNPQGTLQYSACMMDDLLVEVNVATGQVSRRFSMTPAKEGPVHGVGTGQTDHSAHTGHTAGTGGTAARVCSPTWAQPSADGARVYVACNKTSEVLEVDAQTWQLRRKFGTGEAPYNLAVTPDGKYLLVTLKNRKAPATEVIDLAAGRSLARIPASTVLPHGVAVTPDSRFAVVSAEGVGSEPGRVDVIDLRTLQRTSTVEVGQQAGGIAIVADR